MSENRVVAVGGILIGALLLSFAGTYVLYSSKDHPVYAGDVREAAVRAVAPVVRAIPAAGDLSQAFVETAEKSEKAVVYIEVSKFVDRPGGPAYGQDPLFDFFFGTPWGDPGQRRGQRAPREEQRGLGSGFVVDRDQGYILTNNHVIDGADKLRVTLYNGRKLDARVIGSDPKTDVGLIQLKDFDRADIRELPLADSDGIRVGEWVLAVGNPFGLKQTVTSGIVSAKGRANVNIAEYEDFIQTDAAVNPGNSGGPLLNLAGEVVGMNTAIFSRSGGYQGISFAVPSNMLKAVMEQLETGKKIERGQIGVMIQDVDDELKKHFDFKGEHGVLISEVVKDSPAEKAGLKSGDIIVSLNGKPMEDVGQVKNAIGFTGVGKGLALGIWRDGKALEVEVKVGRELGTSEAEVAKASERLGLRVSSLSAKPNAPYDHGVVVEDLDRGGLAAYSGVRQGDIILEVDRQPVQDADEFFKLLKRAEDAESMLLLIDRSGHRIFLLVRNR
jgi:serine protease Do